MPGIFDEIHEEAKSGIFNQIHDESSKPQESKVATQATDTPPSSALSRLGSSFWEGVGGKAAMDILGGASRDPERAKKAKETVMGLVHGLASEPSRVWNELGKAGDAMASGDVPGTAEHIAGSVPLFGAPALNVEHDFQNGDYASGFGHALALLLPFAAGSAKGKLPVAPKIANPNPAEAAAMEYLSSEGVPVSAAAKTGNPYVRGVQKMADTTPLGAVVASKAEAATTDALKKTADKLSSQVFPQAVVPEQAGAAIAKSMEAKSAASGVDANTAYADFRKIESDPANIKTVVVGPPKAVPTGVVDASGNPIVKMVPTTEDIALPTDVRAIKARLVPIVADIEKWMQPAKRQLSAGYQAAKSIIDGPDYIPASQAEAGLGGLKELGRESSGRNAGMAKLIIPKLQAEIDQAVAQAGTPAVDALRAGRAATAAKYGTREILEQLRDEPVQTFRQLTYQKDAGIDLLRKVAKEVPGELAKIGRAFLDDLFSKAQSQGGFDGTQGLWSQWQNMGPQTKALLFKDPQMVSNLDKFFLGAKKLAENPNPSGSGVVSWIAGQGALAVTHPATGIPYLLGAGALSKLMHTPAGVAALTKGVNVTLNGSVAAGARNAAAARILEMAGDAAKPMALPNAADGSTDKPTPTPASSPIPSGNQSPAGMVKMVSPNGEVEDVNPDDVAHYQNLGAKIASVR